MFSFFLWVIILYYDYLLLKLSQIWPLGTLKLVFDYIGVFFFNSSFFIIKVIHVWVHVWVEDTWNFSTIFATSCKSTSERKFKK